MSWFLVILFLTLTFGTLSSESTHHEKRLPSSSAPAVVVVGTVFCDKCLQHSFSFGSHFISGASVGVECKDGSKSKKPRFKKEVKTNKDGEFKVELPFKVSKYVKRIKGCTFELISSNNPNCAMASISTTSSITLKSRNQKEHIFSAGFLSFKPTKKPKLCNQSPTTATVQESKDSVFEEKRFPPSIDPSFPPPLQDPPSPPTLLPPLLPLLPPIIPPLTPPIKEDKRVKPSQVSLFPPLIPPLVPNPFQPPPLIPNPFQPPPLIPNPFQPPSPPFIPNPFQPPPSPTPLIPNPFQPPPSPRPLIPNPFQPPPSPPPFLPNPFQPPPSPPSPLFPNPFQPTPSPPKPPSPLFPFPPIPGLTPSPPPPSPPPPTFPFPFPPLFPPPHTPGSPPVRNLSP
ncbi:hypothetical protein HN51_060198 [Arachis hypogaea]|uniref:Uncharacterized protein n=1 Tax=Arachis hypogaea TaxID=3818 RepID=A0A444X8W9_ARAHY|nr:vegetative cell wall protein gp1 [Arachis ipaensis]XP_025680834.1 vegetative cell wall protein gp1 [Arachis hypogaea]QHN83780.1 uncharacterized protein DS421_20g707730 [Arachis hypogaea]RYQ86104.1 hypothetical protein Ahy_B10g105773 [Arachis hypogaea]